MYMVTLCVRVFMFCLCCVCICMYCQFSHQTISCDKEPKVRTMATEPYELPLLASSEFDPTAISSKSRPSDVSLFPFRDEAMASHEPTQQLRCIGKTETSRVQ